MASEQCFCDGPCSHGRPTTVIRRNRQELANPQDEERRALADYWRRVAEEELERDRQEQEAQGREHWSR